MLHTSHWADDTLESHAQIKKAGRLLACLLFLLEKGAMKIKRLFPVLPRLAALPRKQALCFQLWQFAQALLFSLENQEYAQLARMQLRKAP